MIQYQIDPNIDVQPIDDSLILLALEHNAYYSLNPTGRWFLEHIKQHKTEEEIIREGLMYFDGVTEETLRADYHALIKDLINAGILVKNEENSNT